MEEGMTNEQFRALQRLHNENDADIIAYLEQAMNKQGTIKEALREKMERENFHPET